jgi:hypothetical protein
VARLTGPEDGSRLAYVLRPDNALGSAAGLPAVLYADEDASELADVLTVDGDPIEDSQVTVEATSLLPLVQFPDGVDTLYVAVNDGPVTAVYARVTSGGGGAVDSVNGQTGVVVLDAADVGAASTGDLSAHAGDTTSVHGITDTSALETTSGAATKVSTHAAATDPHGDRAYAAAQAAAAVTTAEGYTDTAVAAVTLTGLGGVPTSRQVIAGTGLSGGGTLAADRTLSVAYGTSSTTAARGDDSRLSDARTPTAHATSHATGNTDPLAPSDIGAVPTSRQVIAGTGLTGGGALSADRTLTVAYGTSSTTAAVGNDARLSDTRTPTDGSVTDAKVSASAAIALSKLATNPLARANHTGTQAASTISDFDAQVRTNRLDQMATAGADVPLGSHKLTGVTDPSSAQDAATKNYVDTGAYGTWTNFPSLGTNVSLGTPAAQYRTAPGNMLQLRGQLAMTGSVAANFTMATLPALAAARQFNVRVIGLGANVFVNITTGGALSQSGTLANGHTMSFDGIEISL